ncbi:MAG: hypothetical protein U5K56_08330 [Halioglobus sp.]|nr:hypothetical protein [Halioglobus sp.]
MMLACGTGSWLRVCREHDCRVSGVDLLKTFDMPHLHSDAAMPRLERR